MHATKHSNEGQMKHSIYFARIPVPQLASKEPTDCVECDTRQESVHGLEIKKQHKSGCYQPSTSDKTKANAKEACKWYECLHLTDIGHFVKNPYHLSIFILKLHKRAIN